MAKNDSSNSNPSTSWTHLLKTFSGHPVLTKQTVIALPPDLLTHISKRAPNFFSADELRFERQLAASGCTGYFEGVEFTYEILNAIPARRRKRKAVPYQGLLKREKPTPTKRMVSSSQTLSPEVTQRRRAYAAWIATHPLFRTNLTQFCSHWDGRWKNQIPLKLTAAGLMNQQLGKAEAEQPFLTAYLNFCSEHSLDALGAGFLPIPSDTTLMVSDSGEANLMPKSGVLLFLPWHLLREDTIAVREIVFGYGRLLLSPLARAWVEEDSDFCIVRYETMLYLYVYLHLAIAARYPKKLRGNTEALDAAFGQFVRGIDASGDNDLSAVESIKRIRLRMQQRLESKIPKALERLDAMSKINVLGELKSQLGALTKEILTSPSLSQGRQSGKAFGKKGRGTS